MIKNFLSSELCFKICTELTEKLTFAFCGYLSSDYMTGMKCCPVQPGSRQCYKLFMNYTLRLHANCVIPARRDPSSVLPGSCFVGTKLSHVIASARLTGIKKLIKKYRQKYISVDRRYIYCVYTTYMTSTCEKKVDKYLCRILSFYRSSHRKCFVQACNFIIKRHQHLCFPANIVKL